MPTIALRRCSIRFDNPGQQLPETRFNAAFGGFAVRFTSVACYGDGCAFIRALQNWIGCSRLENLRILDISVRPNVEQSNASYSGMFNNILNHLGKSWVMLSKPEQGSYSFGRENLRIDSGVPDARFILKP